MSSLASSELALTPEPERRLAPRARTVWRLRQLGLWGPLLVAGIVLGGRLPGVLETVSRALPLAGLALGTTLVPALRWRRWRYEVRQEEIDIRHGTLVITRTLVPMRRVQHVDTTRGMLEQGFALATVVFHTAAGAHTIPLLPREEAGRVRDRIAALTRTSDETSCVNPGGG